MTNMHPGAVIVDDDPTMAAFLREVLEIEGWRVQLQPCGGDVHEQVAQAQPEVVLLDVRQDGYDGRWGLLDRLLRDPRTRAVPVVVCSFDPHLQQTLGDGRGLEQGVFGLSKPFDLDALLGALTAARLWRPRKQRRGTRVAPAQAVRHAPWRARQPEPA